MRFLGLLDLLHRDQFSPNATRSDAVSPSLIIIRATPPYIEPVGQQTAQHFLRLGWIFQVLAYVLMRPLIHAFSMVKTAHLKHFLHCFSWLKVQYVRWFDCPNVRFLFN